MKIKHLFLTVILFSLASFSWSAGQFSKATFAGGCFWCMEPPYEKLEGVFSVTSGYAGGKEQNPTYEEVSSGATGHAEAVQILYDPKKIKYEELLKIFWHNVDPTQSNGQFCDHGPQYRTAIFFHDQEQKRLAEESLKVIKAQLKQTVVTQIVPATHFYTAEDYHQDFYKKNPTHYNTYRAGCGRDRRLRELWGAAYSH